MLKTILEEYDSDKHRRSTLYELSELLKYRDLLGLLISYGIRTRYKRSLLGVLWSFLNPLLTMGVLALAFSALFKFSLLNYPIYLLSGLLIWNFFSQTTTATMYSLSWGGTLLKRIYIPRSIFSISAIGSELFNLIISLIPLFIIMLILGHPFTPALAFLPVAILSMAMFALGMGLCISTLSVYFIDTIHIYQIVLMAWFYITPIIYPADIIPESYAVYLKLNPMIFILELFRSPIYLGIIPGFKTILIAFSWSIFSLLFGWSIFSRKADKFAYRI